MRTGFEAPASVEVFRLSVIVAGSPATIAAADAEAGAARVGAIGSAARNGDAMGIGTTLGVAGFMMGCGAAKAPADASIRAALIAAK